MLYKTCRCRVKQADIFAYKEVMFSNLCYGALGWPLIMNGWSNLTDNHEKFIMNQIKKSCNKCCLATVVFQKLT